MDKKDVIVVIPPINGANFKREEERIVIPYKKFLKLTSDFVPKLTLDTLIQGLNSSDRNTILRTLSEFNNEINRIKDFINNQGSLGDAKCIIEEYLLASPRCNELFTVLKINEKDNIFVYRIFDAFTGILVLNRFEKTVTLNDFIAKEIMNSWMNRVYPLLNGNDVSGMLSALKLLLAITELGSHMTRFLFQKIDFVHIKPMHLGKQRWNKDDSDPNAVTLEGNPRTYYLRFCNTFLSTGDDNITRAFMRRIPFIATIFTFIDSDPSSSIYDFLSVLTENVMLRPKISVKEKNTLIKSGFINSLTDLLQSKNEHIVKSVSEFLSLVIDSFSLNLTNTLISIYKDDPKLYKGEPLEPRRPKEFLIEQIYLPKKSHREETMLDTLIFLKPEAKRSENKKLALKILREFPEVTQEFLGRLKDVYVKLNYTWLTKVSFLTTVLSNAVLPQMRMKKDALDGPHRPPLSLVEPLLHFVCPMDKIFFSRSFILKPPLVMSKALDLLIIIMKGALKILNMLDETNQTYWGTFRSIFRGLLKNRIPSIATLTILRSATLKLNEKPRSFILGQYYLTLSLYFKAFPELIKESNFNYSELFMDYYMIDSLSQYRLLTLLDSFPYLPTNFDKIFNGLQFMTQPESHPLVRDRARRYMFKVVSNFGIVPLSGISKIEFTLWTSAISSDECSAFFTKIMKASFNKTGYYAAKTSSLTSRLLMCTKDLANTRRPEESEASAKQKMVYYNTVRALLEPLLTDSEKAIYPIEDVPKDNFLLKVSCIKEERTLMEALDKLQTELFPAAILFTTYYLSDSPEVAFNLISRVAYNYIGTAKMNMAPKSTTKLMPVALLANPEGMKKIIENSSASIFQIQKIFRDLGCEECDTFGKFVGDIMGSSERTTEFADYFANHCSNEALQSFIENTADGELRHAYVYCFATALDLAIERRILFKFLTREILIKALKMVKNSDMPINGGKLDHTIRTIFDHSRMNTSLFKCSFDPYKDCSEGLKVYTGQFFIYKSPTDDYIQTIVHFIEQSKTSVPVLKFSIKLFEYRKQTYFPRISIIWNTILDYIIKHNSALVDESKVIPALLEDILKYPQAQEFSLLRKLFSVGQTKELVKGCTKILRKYFVKGENLNKHSVGLFEALLDCYEKIDPYEVMKKKIESKDYSKEEYPEVKDDSDDDDVDIFDISDEEDEDKKEDESESEDDDLDEDVEMDEMAVLMKDLCFVKFNYKCEPNDPAKAKRMREGFYSTCLDILYRHMISSPERLKQDIDEITTVLRRRINWVSIEELRDKKSFSGSLLLKVAISIAQRPVTKNLIYFLKDIVKKVYGTWDEKHKHRRLSSIHKAISENIDSYRAYNVSWEDLASLIYLMYTIDPSLCEKDIDPILVGFAEEYTVTPSKKDRKILCLLRLLDKNGSHLSRIGYTWGSLAKSILEGHETDIYRAFLSDASGLLNEVIIENTIEHYPYTRKMNEDDSLMDEEDPLPEDGYLKEEKENKEDTDNEVDNNIDDKYSDEVYDPVYLLPIILNLINHMPEGGVKLFIDIKVLHLVLCSLSTEDETLLKLSYTILFGFMNIAPKKALGERSQIVSLLELIRNSVSSTEMRFPVLFTNFAAKSLSIIDRPSDMMYTEINKYILKDPKINFEKIPFVDRVLNSFESNDIIQKERHWILEFIASSIKPFENNYQLWFKNKLFDKLLFEFQNSSTDKKSHLLILTIIERAVNYWGWSGKKTECPYLLSWLCSTKLLVRYPEEASRIIISIATQPDKKKVQWAAHGLSYAAATLLRSSFIDAGIKVLESILDFVSQELVPGKLFELLTKILATTIENDDVNTTHTVAKIIVSWVSPAQERPPELNDLMRRAIGVIQDQTKYVDWLEGKTK